MDGFRIWLCTRYMNMSHSRSLGLRASTLDDHTNFRIDIRCKIVKTCGAHNQLAAKEWTKWANKHREEWQAVRFGFPLNRPTLHGLTYNTFRFKLLFYCPLHLLLLLPRFFFIVPMMLVPLVAVIVLLSFSTCRKAVRVYASWAELAIAAVGFVLLMCHFLHSVVCVCVLRVRTCSVPLFVREGLHISFVCFPRHITYTFYVLACARDERVSECL